MHYDHESNLISITLKRGTVDHVIEAGNFLIHVNRHKTPLLIEILDGGKFVSQLQRVRESDIIKATETAA